MNNPYITKPLEIIRKPAVSSKPFYMQIEATTHCNLACKMCVRNETIKNPMHLKFDKFKELFDQVVPKKLTLSGVGEPMLNPELYDMVDYARKHGTQVMIPTNATILKRRKLSEKLVDAGLNVLKISVDAASKETYLKVRLEDYFDDIIEGIQVLEDVKRERKTRFPELRFDFVILEDNFHEIPDLVMLSKRLGIKIIFFRALQVEGIQGDREELLGRDVNFPQLFNAVKKGLALAQEHGIKTNLKEIAQDFMTYESLYIEHDSKMNKDVCLLPWLQCFVSVKGELAPCCATYSNESWSAGNVYEEGFEAVWNSQKMQGLRHKFKMKQNDLAICTDCIPRSVPVLLKMSAMLPGFTYRTKEKVRT
jgi:radical SAM protein with 4Fe4S-binding SPASM domain